MLIVADNLDISPLKQAVVNVVPRATAKDLELFFVVKQTPVNGVLQVTLVVAFSLLAEISSFNFLI